MTEFGDTLIAQTTLASMFPISYTTLVPLMSPRTPQPMAPLAPEKVRPLILAPFSLNYSGFLKAADLNTELLFLSRAISAPTQTVPGGTGGVIGGQALMIDVTFTNVTIDDVTVPVTIQGLVLSGSLRFVGATTSLGIVHFGYNTIGGSLTFASDITLASLELYGCVVTGDITLPSGPSVVSLLIYGQYPQISLDEVSNSKIYPSLSSLLYLNGVDGQAPRDIPPGTRGFGAYTLDGLTQSSYPLITTLALPNPWSQKGIDVLFPNLISLYALGYPGAGAVTIPATPETRYSSLTILSAQELTSLDLSNRAPMLTGGIRIVGCPLLTGVLLRTEPQSSTPPRDYRSLVIERCALVYLRGARGLTRPPSVLRLGDHVSPTLSVTPHNATRLLDYVLQALPTVGEGSTIPATASDYLPNVIVALAELMPLLILYPVMQTVEYGLVQPARTYTQYSGGANPVVPITGTLTGAAITVSPFGIRYSLRILAASPAILSSVASVAGTSDKGSLFPTLNHHATKIAMIVAIVVGVLLIIGIVVGVSVAAARKRRAAMPAVRESQNPKLKK